MKEVKECFRLALKDEEKGKKHKGLLKVKQNHRGAEEYIAKAKKNLELCEYFKEQRLDYKIPEEWFYTMYYCASAILAKFGVETRSQKCTALFLRYAKEKNLINLDDEFIERITVYREKESKTDVDEREQSRYGSSIQSEEIIQKYNKMMETCKGCIDQTEDIIYSNKNFELPEDLTEK